MTDNKYIDAWHSIVSILLIIVCIYTPIEIAFSFDDPKDKSDLVNNIIDLIFLIDIILCFNTEFMTENYEIKRDRKSISINYLQGWFLIDIVSIIPF